MTNGSCHAGALRGLCRPARQLFFRVHPAGVFQDRLGFRILVRLLDLLAESPGGGTCITLEKVRLKLDREQNPTASEISRMESFVLRSRLQALVILVLFTKSRGDMPMISRKTRRKWVGLQWHRFAR